MLGLLDMGGGMRGIYGAGVTDCFLDNGIEFDYCIGVSAGCANIASFLAKQKGRNYKFYTEYAKRKEYMGIETYIKDGSFFNLDYVYSTLSNSDGENPLDYDALMENKSQFTVVATSASNGEPVYFNKSNLSRDDLGIIKASSCVPVANKPYCFNGEYYYDGGVSDPIPVEKAFSDGCDKVVAILTKPIDFVKKPEKFKALMHLNIGEEYPEIMSKLDVRHEIFNNAMDKVREYQQQGSVTVIAPKELKGINMATKDPKKLSHLYNMGYEDAQSIIKNNF